MPRIRNPKARVWSKPMEHDRTESVVGMLPVQTFGRKEKGKKAANNQVDCIKQITSWLCGGSANIDSAPTVPFPVSEALLPRSLLTSICGAIFSACFPAGLTLHPSTRHWEGEGERNVRIHEKSLK